ncbi:MAG: hypothetical protein ABIJ14_00410 [Nanoarchaeota archaeon]|nr:hypothetical protein [Nanoarchaeota archaeon]
MVGVINSFSEGILKIYNLLTSVLPSWAQNFINLFLLVLIVVAYAIFVWKFYKFISRKNPLGLNLNKYNKIEHSFFSRLITGVLYFVEYILILPFLIFAVFSVFTFFLIILTQNQDISQILVISAVIIATIRMTAYYKEGLSQDIAKLLPFTLLAVAALNPNTFSQSQYLETILNHFSQIPNFFGQIKFYLLFIIILEIILTFFDYVISLFDFQGT